MTLLNNVPMDKPTTLIHFDWLTVVFTATDKQVQYYRTGFDYMEAMKRLLMLDKIEFATMKHGIYTYEIGLMGADQGSIIIGYNNRLYRGSSVMFQLSGRGVDTFMQILDKNDIKFTDVFDKIRKANGTFSRVDSAMDFFNYPKTFSPMYLAEQGANCRMVSHLKKLRYVVSFNADHGLNNHDYDSPDVGTTFYIGKGNKEIRIYNKLAERRAKYGYNYNVKSWYRWEFQLRDTHAESFMIDYERFAYDQEQAWRHWVINNFRFIDDTGKHQEKRSRYPDQSWYFKYFYRKDNKHFKPALSRTNQYPTMERAIKFTTEQAMPSYATIFQGRIEVYMNNGLSYEDAVRASERQMGSDLLRSISQGRYHKEAVASFVSERGGNKDLGTPNNLVDEDHPAGLKDYVDERNEQRLEALLTQIANGEIDNE